MTERQSVYHIILLFVCLCLLCTNFRIFPFKFRQLIKICDFFLDYEQHFCHSG